MSFNPKLVLANGEPFGIVLTNVPGTTTSVHVVLTNVQVSMAQKLGISVEEYAHALIKDSYDEADDQ